MNSIDIYKAMMMQQIHRDPNSNYFKANRGNPSLNLYQPIFFLHFCDYSKGRSLIFWVAIGSCDFNIWSEKESYQHRAFHSNFILSSHSNIVTWFLHRTQFDTFFCLLG